MTRIEAPSANDAAIIFYLKQPALKDCFVIVLGEDGTQERLHTSDISAKVTPPPDRVPSKVEYYLHTESGQTGPFTVGQLRSMWNSGSITSANFYWHEGLDAWHRLADLAETLEQDYEVRARRLGRESQSDAPAEFHPVDAAASADSVRPHSANPPEFTGVVIVTCLLPIIGFIVGIVWLCNPRYRASGGALIAISFAASLILGMIIAFMSTH